MKCNRCCNTIEDERFYCKECLAIEQIKLHGMFKRKVIKKHGTKCRICGNIDKKLFSIHHTDTKDDDDRYNVDKVEVLCRPCHDKVHGIIRPMIKTNNHELSERKKFKERVLKIINKKINFWNTPNLPLKAKSRLLISELKELRRQIEAEL